MLFQSYGACGVFFSLFYPIKPLKTRSQQKTCGQKTIMKLRKVFTKFLLFLLKYIFTLTWKNINVIIEEIIVVYSITKNIIYTPNASIIKYPIVSISFDINRSREIARNIHVTFGEITGFIDCL
jgi:uncharacterized membrane protein